MITKKEILKKLNKSKKVFSYNCGLDCNLRVSKKEVKEYIKTCDELELEDWQVELDGDLNFYIG